MTAPYTHKNISAIADAAPGSGLGAFQSLRFGSDDLRTERTGFTHLGIEPNARPPFAHRHQEAEEVYVVIRGSGRLKLDDEILEVALLDAVRVAPTVTRAWEAGPEGLEVLAFGPRHEGDGEAITEWWTD